MQRPSLLIHFGAALGVSLLALSAQAGGIEGGYTVKGVENCGADALRS